MADLLKFLRRGVLAAAGYSEHPGLPEHAQMSYILQNAKFWLMRIGTRTQGVLEF